jgi:hypothetical protein
MVNSGCGLDLPAFLPSIYGYQETVSGLYIAMHSHRSSKFCHVVEDDSYTCDLLFPYHLHIPPDYEHQLSGSKIVQGKSLQLFFNPDFSLDLLRTGIFALCRKPKRDLDGTRVFPGTESGHNAIGVIDRNLGR